MKGLRQPRDQTYVSKFTEWNLIAVSSGLQRAKAKTIGIRVQELNDH